MSVITNGLKVILLDKAAVEAAFFFTMFDVSEVLQFAHADIEIVPAICLYMRERFGDVQPYLPIVNATYAEGDVPVLYGKMMSLIEQESPLHAAHLKTLDKWTLRQLQGTWQRICKPAQE